MERGLPYAFLRGCDEGYLNGFLSPDNHYHSDIDPRPSYRAVPIATITRWEFDKEWGPTLILWSALRGAVALVALDSTGSNDAFCR